MEFPQLDKYPYFALDTETTGLQYKRDKVFGVSLSTPDDKDYYWDVRHYPQVLDWLEDEVPKSKAKVLYANASFDVRMLDNSNVRLIGCDMDDVIVRASCIDEHLMAYNLEALTKKYGMATPKDTSIYEKLAAIFGGRATKNVQMPNLHKAPVDVVAPYAKDDTRSTLQLWEWQQGEIARQGIERIVEFERDLMSTFIGMEMHGIRIDEAYAEEAVDKMNPIIKEHQRQIDRLFGCKVNVNSSPQVKELFEPKQKDGEWYANDGTLLKKTEKGNASLDAETLRIMSHPGAAMILEQRSIIKTRDTFLLGHVLGSNIDGRVYPTINQSKKETGGTSTGRLSIQGPAMQQIPSRNKKVAALVKPCFLPDEGHVWVDADMASFEVRVFAHLAGDQRVLDAYKDNPGLDFHQFVGDITGLVRNAEYSGQPNAKQLNLSMIFNSGNGAIADKMGMPWQYESFLPRGKVDKKENYITYKKAGPEAMKVIDLYHSRLPGVKKLAEGASKKAKSRGYVWTKFGRHLRFPNGWKVYKASGLLIQATSADVNKENISIITEILGDEGKLLLNTHDSYSMSMPEEIWKDKFSEVKNSIERPVLDVPLVLDLNGTGDNWWDAIKGE